ncbi:MAG: siphovirus Gp157 family protein [Acidobacteriaceae bacterium]|nr:siphovirus Gp157 family protein [Acidobacteriaceae bacterium]
MCPDTSALESSQSSTVLASVAPESPPTRTGPQALSKTMSLFELDESLCLLMDSAVEAASENDGEIPEELRRAVLEYCEAFGQKVDNIATYIHALEFEAANARAEIDRLAVRKSAAENRVERLKGLLKFFMASRNIKSMKGRLNTISLRKNSQDSLILTDPTKLPSEFWRISVVLNGAQLEEVISYLPREHRLRACLTNPDAFKREPDNARIRAAIASGITVKGAEVRREHHVRLT